MLRRSIFFIIYEMKPQLLLLCVAATAFHAHGASAFLGVVTGRFQKWDADHDGVLSTTEIEHAVASPEFKGNEAAALASLRLAVKTKAYKLPALTLEQIRKLVPRPQGQRDQPNFEAMFDSALKRIQAGSPQLLDASRLHLESLEQGRLGDCFCLAPLGALLHTRPHEVVGMFSFAADGAVAVALGGGRVIKVPPPTDAERALMAGTDGSGIWANCYEKAVGQIKMKEDDPGHPTALSVVTLGGSAGTMLSILTGHEIERISCVPFRDKSVSKDARQKLLVEIRRQMIITQAAGRLICGGTASGQTADGHKPSGIRGPHAYAILGYEPETDAVTLWDPHGDNFKPAAEPPGLTNGYLRTQGLMRVSLKELVQWFGGFSFETDIPLARQVE